MRQDWIINVLTDLQIFASTNNLPLLAAELEQTLQVAEQELQILHGAGAARSQAAAPPVAE